ncbi:DUF368 domain-containing protein [Georgenia sp. 10Sc9-8]|uniref:DUF368 domain-containing protein n=1 Tax=Georgenia halotolerans TaxID=3028317 RepID=A0ABT5TVW7_9MICO|nr:DUF368 domain-containing protein [Georgenia halotolerans]
MQLQQTATQVLRGFLMGSADIVPGVSGGTVALVLGIYGRLVAAIRSVVAAMASLARADLPEAGRRLRAVPWVWLLALLGGVGAAILLLAALLERLLEQHPEPMAGLFFGLIVGAVVISWRLVRRVTWSSLVLTGLVAAAFFLLLGLQESTHAEGTELATRPWWAFFLAGAVAICAMILPGISGSFILLMLGMYTEVLGAVDDRNLPVLLAFLAGAAVGLASFSTLLSWLLEHYHDTVLAVLIGLMLGSLRILWPWPDGLESTTLGLPDGGPVLLPLALAAVGLLAVLGVEAVGERRGVSAPPRRG